MTTNAQVRICPTKQLIASLGVFIGLYTSLSRLGLYHALKYSGRDLFNLLLATNFIILF